MTRMRLTSFAATLLASIAVLGAASQDLPQTTARFRSGSLAVMVDASVRDRNRRVVTGLKADDFTVLDNGVPQQVSDVSYGKLPIDVTVALDVSQSVSGGVLKQLQAAVSQLMRDLASQDRLKLLLFNAQIVRTIDFTTDEKAVERAIREVRAGGGTALLDAISVSLVSTADPDRRQLVIFFTDGNDSSSTTAPDILTEVARRTRATLAFVIPAPSMSSPLVTSTVSGVSSSVTTTTIRPSRLPAYYAFLSSLAAETGGVVLPITQSSSLSRSFSTVLNDFRSTYVLYFTPVGVDRSGHHTIEVKVNKDGASVQARRGYFAQ